MRSRASNSPRRWRSAGAAGAVAGALGPTLGSAIVEGFGWRWAFYINLPIGIFTILAGRRSLGESSDAEARVPAFTGIGLIAAAAGVLSYGVVRTESVGWTSPRTVWVMAGGLVLLAAFVIHQQRTSAPALNLDLFAIVNFRWGNLAGLVFGIAFSAMFLGSILFLTQVWGWSILQAGFGVAPGPALVAVLAPRFGALAGRIGQRPILVAGGVSYALGGLYRVAFLDATPDYVVEYLPSMLLTGVGVACVFPQLSSVVAQSLPSNRIGVGGAALQAVRQFGGTFGVALTIAFLGAPRGLDDALARFERVWWLIVAGGLATSILSLPIGRTPSRPA
ncbi:MAG: MFS transporter [Ilumatobacter sp.]